MNTTSFFVSPFKRRSSPDNKNKDPAKSTDTMAASTSTTTIKPGTPILSSEPRVLTIKDMCPESRQTLPWWEEALLIPCFIWLCAPICFSLGVAVLLYLVAPSRQLWKYEVYFYLAYWTALYLDLLPRQERLNPGALHTWFMRAMNRYFSATVIVEDPSSIRPNTPYMGAQSPHGIFPIASFCAAFYNPLTFPGRDVYCLTASALQTQPGFWHWMASLGARPISPAAIKRLADNGEVCCLVPGGIAEMFFLDPANQVDKILIRRGFIREALKNGLDICPIYHFNHTQTFRYILPPWLNAPLAAFCRKTGLPGCFLIGRWGLFVPYKVPLTSVIGRAIRVQKSAGEPTEAEIEGLVEEYKAAVQRIYYTYRPAGAERKLVMVDSDKKAKKAG